MHSRTCALIIAKGSAGNGEASARIRTPGNMACAVPKYVWGGPAGKTRMDNVADAVPTTGSMTKAPNVKARGRAACRRVPWSDVLGFV